MKSWSDVKKRLEEDCLAPSLRGRVSFFMTRYSHAHDEFGRVAVRVDGKEVLKGCDLDWSINSAWYREEALRGDPKIKELETTDERWDRIADRSVDLGCVTRWDFYDAYDCFENQSIEDSLNGKNGLVRLMAILDRRVGKRRLRKLRDDGWGREPDWLLPFFRLRLEAEGIPPQAEGFAVERMGSGELSDMAEMAARMWEHPAEELAREFSKRMDDPEAALFTAKRNGQVVGFAQCQLRHDYVEGCSTSPVAYLEGIFVDEAHRLQGAAAALLEACETWAREQGCAEFASDCELDNAESLRFHRSRGFTEVNRIICFKKTL